MNVFNLIFVIRWLRTHRLAARVVSLRPAVASRTPPLFSWIPAGLASLVCDGRRARLCSGTRRLMSEPGTPFSGSLRAAPYWLHSVRRVFICDTHLPSWSHWKTDVFRHLQHLFSQFWGDELDFSTLSRRQNASPLWSTRPVEQARGREFFKKFYPLFLLIQFKGAVAA